MNIVEISRTPHEIPPPKKNNFIHIEGGGYNIIQRFKYLILFESLLGINRLYLIGCRNFAKHFCYTYSTIVVLSDVFAITLSELYTTTNVLYKNTVAIEYLLLAFSASVLQRKPLSNFFSNLQYLDEKLNISVDIKLTSPIRIYIYAIISLLVYIFADQFLFIAYGGEDHGINFSIGAAYLGLVAHDIEMIFFSVLLIMVSRRLRIIKAHVVKLFNTGIDKNASEATNTLENLSKKVNLDVSSLHESYDLLHKCSQQLNSAMAFPITITLVAAGLLTILILKSSFTFLQIRRDPNMKYDVAVKVILTIGIGRCLKYIILLMFPCYFSTVTKTQVETILTLLHDILHNNNTLDKTDRRKLKAFSQLCRDNAFIYELWGFLRLDMSLPLGYTSLCTTCLIIFVQYSKFID